MLTCLGIWLLAVLFADCRVLSRQSYRDYSRTELEIHVFAWKRIRSLSRLIKSLETAVVPSGMSASITFNVDHGYAPGVLSIIKSLKWTIGRKMVNVRQHHYGLPQNILLSWLPTNSGQFALFLEDDVELSQYFLLWAEDCIKAMKEGMKGLIGCSLYTPIVNEIGAAPNAWSPPKWTPIKELKGDSCFMFQLPCSWGAIYSSPHWLVFLQYYKLRFWMDNAPDAPNSRTIEWFKSWKRHLVELMLENGWFLRYPFSGANHASFSTNYFEKGVHSVPENGTPVFMDSLKQFDHRFTVPLIDSYSTASELIHNCSANKADMKFINLYHQKVGGSDELRYDMKRLWSEKNLNELIKTLEFIN